MLAGKLLIKFIDPLIDKSNEFMRDCEFVICGDATVLLASRVFRTSLFQTTKQQQN
jgi:hypothetical protein